MTIPKKPNRRRKKKTKHVMTPEEMERQTRLIQMRRYDQSLAIRNKIINNAGNILHEIPMFMSDLGEWVRYGKMKQGKCEIASANRIMEWVFHENINHVPDVWIRAPDYESDGRERDVSGCEHNERFTGGDVRE